MRNLLALALVCLALAGFSPPAWAGDRPAAAGKDSAGPTLTRPQQQVLYEAQQVLVGKKDPAKAAAILTEFLEGHPQQEHYLLYYALGLARYHQDQPEQAAQAFDQALKLKPDHRPSCLNLAAVLYGLNKFSRAAELWAKAFDLAAQPEPRLLYQAGAAHYQAGELAAAAKVLDRLLGLPGRPHKGWLELYIHVLVRLKRTGQALTLLTDFLNRFPGEESYWRLLAQLHLEQEDYRPAAAALETAHGLKNPPAQGWRQLAAVYFHLGSPLAGVRALRRAAGPEPRPIDRDELARWLAQAGRVDEALAEMDRAIKAEPTAARLLARGRLLFEQGRYQEAKESLARAVTLEPTLYQAQFMLGYASLELNLFEEARRAFSRAAKSAELKPQAEAALAVLRHREEEQ